jgi:hypothetical protein
MWEVLESIENSGFATWVREAPTVFAYSTVLALHTFGMAFLVGFSGVIATRVLGIARSLPLAPLAGIFPLIILGFWVNAATGVVLTMLAARSLLSNPDFYIKLIAIAAALVCLQRLKQHAFGPPDVAAAPAARRWALGMLTCWGVAILAGRLTAYSNFVRKQSAVAVVIATVLLLAVRWIILAIPRRSGVHNHGDRRAVSRVRTPVSNTF